VKKLLLFLFLSTTAYTWAKTATIKGHINGKLPQTIRYTAPVEGYIGFEMNDTATVDAEGNFKIKIKTSEVTFVDLYYNFQPAGYLVVSPGGTYNIMISENNGRITHTITGTDSLGQQLYNKMVDGHRITVLQDLALEGDKLKSPLALVVNFEQRRLSDFDKIFKLPLQSVSNDFILAVLKERYRFYTAALGYTIRIKQLRSEQGNEVMKLKSFRALWRNLYQYFPITNTTIGKSPWDVYFLDGYTTFKRYDQVKFDSSKLAAADALYTIKTAAQIIPEENLEYYLAAVIYRFVFEGKNDTTITEAFNYFKQLYPKSRYTKFIELKTAP